jgi:hypothetical protein
VLVFNISDSDRSSSEHNFLTLLTDIEMSDPN